MALTELKDKLQRNKPLRVLFLNDLGFQYGAGIAELRQIQSFLLMGHEARGLCWLDNIESSIPFVPLAAGGTWLGMHQMPRLHAGEGCTDRRIVEAVLAQVISNLPDLVIVGNLHGSGWPLALLPALQDLGIVVVAYMHDCFLITGRCTHPFSCRLYATGCDDRCASPHHHPALAPERIAEAWQLRRRIFEGPGGVFIGTNSRWTLGMVRQALPRARFADVIHLGLDEGLFRPIDRTLARRLLGLPQDEFIVLGGAINVDDPHKGGHLFFRLATTVARGAVFLAFGAETENIEGVHATGLMRDYRKMPLLYSCADLFVATSLAESFGQTFCEAAACGIPIVAFNIEGIPDAARHNVNARLVDTIDIANLLNEIGFLRHNPQERLALGRAGRSMVEAEFTLRHQALRWSRYLHAITAQ
jgi:glycosyltransferase involved in cell wall biosynthesis